jgi:hypothetical protein
MPARSRPCATALALLLPLCAQAGPLDAVGILSSGTAPPGAATAVCTGTLVAPDLVLTAGHCLPGDAAAVRFRPGWGAGGPPLAIPGAEVLRPPPTGAPALPGPLGALPQDVAILRLSAPVDGIRPLPLGPAPGAFGRHAFRAYDRGRPEAPRIDATCRVNLDRPPVWGLTCRVVSGNSGAPLLSLAAGGGWQVAAVLVAAGRGDDPIAAYAVAVPPALAARIAE